MQSERSTPPPAEVAAQWQIIEEIHADVKATRQLVQQHDARLDQHDEAITELRESHTLQREIRTDLREQGKALAQLSRDVGTVIRSDASQTVDIAKLEAAIAMRVVEQVRGETTAMASAAGTEAGHAAGARTSRRWGGAAVALSLVAMVTALARSCEALVAAGAGHPAESSGP